MIRYRAAGSRPKSKLSMTIRRKKPCNRVNESNQDNEDTIIHGKKIKHAQAQKNIFPRTRVELH